MTPDQVPEANHDHPHGHDHDHDHPHPHSTDELPIPALLRATRGSYANAIRASLAEAGFDDVPRNGGALLSGLVEQGLSTSAIARELGVTKQAISQLIDALVLRGYLERRINPDDRRRMTLEVTERGQAAAAAIAAGVENVDAALAKLITPEQYAGMRAGLAALASIKRRMGHHAMADAG